jgi:hypothetical protein
VVLIAGASTSFEAIALLRLAADRRMDVLPDRPEKRRHFPCNCGRRDGFSGRDEFTISEPDLTLPGNITHRLGHALTAGSSGRGSDMSRLLR